MMFASNELILLLFFKFMVYTSIKMIMETISNYISAK